MSDTVVSPSNFLIWNFNYYLRTTSLFRIA